MPNYQTPPFNPLGFPELEEFNPLGFPANEQPQNPYAVPTPMTAINPMSNPYGQGGGLRGRLRDALLAGGSAGHNRNRMDPVMKARMFDRGMAPEQMEYMEQQRLMQEYEQQQRDRTESKKNKEAAYVDYALGVIRSGGGTPMSMRSWFQLDDASRSQLVVDSTSNLGQNPYNTVSSAGLFTGSQADWNALSTTDKSKLVVMATTPEQLNGRGNLTREEFLEEINPKDWTSDSYRKALETGDIRVLVPRGNVEGLSPDQIQLEVNTRKEYMKDMQPIWELQEGHAKLVTALQRGDGTGDIAAIFQFMKNLDPRSTVREGEFQLAAQVAGLKENALNLWNKYKDGDTLPPAARKQLADLSYQIVQLSKTKRDQLIEDYDYRTGRYKLDKKAVMGSRSVYDYDNLPRYIPSPAEEEPDLNSAEDRARSNLEANAAILGAG